MNHTVDSLCKGKSVETEEGKKNDIRDENPRLRQLESKTPKKNSLVSFLFVF